ncbi:MAG: ATP phosphoribosyltransferase regulatory subunit [Shimia sp.]
MAEAAQRAVTADLLARFEALGAARIEAEVLQDAETLLDLYGEDIRARAYVTQDPLRGERMLRPDFTVPVVQAHMAAHGEPARYCYAGTVFRRQTVAGRASEYPQVGLEIFDRGAPEAVEAEVFAALHGALEGLPVTPVIGDMGPILAALDGLPTSQPRKAMLLRHIWRPERFRALLARYGAPAPGSPPPVAAPEIGLRSASDVAARRAALEADAAVPPLSPDLTEALARLMAIAAPAAEAVEALRALSPALPGIAPTVAGLVSRLAALEARGIDAGAMRFEVSYGRTSMEYYDGFVFGFTAPGRPPVATGGRYDALTRVLGQGRHVPAVGGVVRPDLVVALREGGA